MVLIYGIHLHFVYCREDGIIGVMNKIVKMHKESILSFNQKGRPELAADEQAQCDVIISYLPKQLTTEEVTKLVEETIAKLGATSVKDMGKVGFNDFIWGYLLRLLIVPNIVSLCPRR